MFEIVSLLKVEQAWGNQRDQDIRACAYALCAAFAHVEMPSRDLAIRNTERRVNQFPLRLPTSANSPVHYVWSFLLG